MFIKQVMARPVPAHPKWKYSLNRESMILFSQENIIWHNVFMRKAGNNQKKEWHILPYFHQSFTE